MQQPHEKEINYQKLTDLVHYICFKCFDPTVLGATKLHKTLWHSEVQAFLTLGQPITGETYIKRQHGPVSKHLPQVIEDLRTKGLVAVRQVTYHGYPKTEYVALKDPDIHIFGPEEISIVDDVIQFVCHDHTAQSISRLTHDDIWEMAEIGEEIPVYAVLASRLGEITEQDIKWAHQVLSTRQV